MKNLFERYKSLCSINVLAALLVGICVFVFWGYAYPHALSYREQYQLFLWTGDYFVDEMKTAGGLAQYLGEFLVQFFIYPWLGALILGIVFALITYLVGKLLDKKQWVLALTIPALLLWHMGDENVMMSYPVAIIIALLSYLAMRKVNVLVDILVYPVMYWLIGPMVWLYALLRINKDKMCFIGLIYLLALQLGSSVLILKQWPMVNVMLGMWYYRYEDVYCVLQIVIPAVIVVIAKLHGLLTFDKKYILQSATVLLLVFFAIQNGYDKEKYELIKQDYLIRNQRWNEIISNAEKYTVETPFWCESVNLALAMTRQLSQRQFAFYQSGPDALMMGMVRDMTSNLPTMEAFYRLGMTNECLRYAFDLQESIPLGKKSGRLTMRIAECCIVSGRYAVAKKHLGLLKKSLFYKTWAENTEKFVGNESLINSHPVYGKMRRNKFANNFLFYHPELAKVFYQLFMSNTDNKMALEYMLGQVLLEGDAQTFFNLVGAVNQFGGYSGMPYAYQDAINCIQAQGHAPGSRYGEYAGRMKREIRESMEMNNKESAH